MCQTGSGKLIAAFDFRQGSNADLPNVIDIQYCTSLDGGLTWSSPVTLAAHTGGSTSTTANGRGDCALLFDPAGGTLGQGRVWAFYDYSPATIGLSNSDNSTTTASTTTLHPYARYSDDDGATWSAEIDLIASVKTSSMFGPATASGHGFVGADGTLYVPYFYLTAQGGSTYVAYFGYSTDHGTTWQRSSLINGSNMNEHHLVQLPNGSLVDDSRPASPGARLVSTASSITGTWTTNSVPTLPDPGCNGDIIRVDPSNTSPMGSWLLASGCASTVSRSNLTVWLSKDGGVTWPSSWQVYAGGAAYSSMVRLNEGTFGIFWEDTDHAALSFAKFSLANLRY